MKQMKIVCAVLMTMILMLSGAIISYAMETGFSTEELDKEEKQVLISSFGISLLYSEPDKRPIDCFDVNESGLIAIGFSDSEKKTICVYTVDGEFQYGYMFDCYGSFNLEWDKDNIIIYLVRSDAAIAVSPDGEITDTCLVSNTIENDTYRRNFLESTKRVVGDCEYIIKNDTGIFDLFASSYSQLVVTNNGEVSIIYDVSKEQTVKNVVIFICVILFIAVVISLLVREFIRLNRKQSNNTTGNKTQYDPDKNLN